MSDDLADDAPHIEQRNGRAMIVGYRLSVVDIIGILRVSGYSTQATADYFRVAPEIVESCRVYEARHQEEIDAEIERAAIDFRTLPYEDDDEFWNEIERFFSAEGSGESSIPTDEPITEAELEAYRESNAPVQRRIVEKVARMMLADPGFRYRIEAEMDNERASTNPQLDQARAMFEIGQDPGRIWVWITGLKTYGEGDTWLAAYHDTLDEIGYALQELWAATKETPRDEDDKPPA